MKKTIKTNNFPPEKLSQEEYNFNENERRKREEILEIKKNLIEQIKQGRNETATTTNNIKKLKWNCSPSILGYLITELANKGFIEYPLHNGEINPTGLAKICFDIFEIDSSKENLIKEFNSNKNSLSDTKRAKFFSLPELKDLK